MTPKGPIKLVSELLDLPLMDSKGVFCGIVDDVQFKGDKQLKLDALLVGPGAYRGRMPGWLFWLTSRIAGQRIVRVPMNRIKTIGPVVKLDCTAAELGLARSETAAGRWLPHKGAL